MATYYGSATYFPLTDWLGTKRVELGVTGSTVAMAEQCTSLPFGDGLDCTGTDVNQLHFTGKERDTESNNDYFDARYYASNIAARFLTPDWSKNPEGVPYADFTNPQSLNLYSYMRNNPLSGTDPDGHCDQNGQNCSVWDHIAGALGGALNIIPQTNNLINSIVNAGISPFTSYQFPMAATIQPDAHASSGGIATGEALQVLAPVGDLARGAEMLNDSALVVRGGVATTEQLTKGAETISADGSLSGVSVNSANGASIEQLSQGLMNTQVSVTTVGDVRSIGGDVKPSPSSSNPVHCDMCNVDANQASKIFKQQPNPSNPQ